ncbi:hypothetical protein N7465_007741 [Penicillium sp. CMV-2018d]|nr:hypothetical protein N7465_007741 [Penicillium sp. CMV-2018d]
MIHSQSDRGGLRLQDNRQTGNNHFNQPPTSITHYNHRLQTPTSTSLTLQDNRETGQPSTSILDHPPRSSTSIIHLDHPPRSSTSIIHLDHPLRPSTSNHQIHQPDCSGLRLQDNQQTGNNHFNQPPTSIIRFEHQQHLSHLYNYFRPRGTFAKRPLGLPFSALKTLILLGSRILNPPLTSELQSEGRESRITCLPSSYPVAAQYKQEVYSTFATNIDQFIAFFKHPEKQALV